MIHQIIGITAGVISLLAYGLYIYKIWWGNTRPSKSSWWILSFVWIIVLLSSVSLAPGNTINEQWTSIASRWLSVSYIIGSLVIAVSTIWRGSGKKWNLFDYACLVSAGVAMICYFFFNNSAASLVFAIFADLCGIMPTIKHAWQNPHEEDLTAWIVESFASLLGILAVTHWSLTFQDASDWASPVYLLIINIIIVCIIARQFVKK